MSQGPTAVSLRIRLPYRNETELLEGYRHNLSRSEIFIATERERSPGTIVSLEVLLADGGRVLSGEAVVAKEVPRARPGILLRFLTLDAESRDFLDRTFTAPAERAERMVLGVDLGTTATRVALVKDGLPGLVTRGVGEDPSRDEALRGALQDAREKLALPVARAVLAVPAHFGEHKRAELRVTAEQAGWRVERLISAPTALAVAYAAGRALPRRRLCVVDFGAKKLDVSIVEVEGDEVDVLACGGDAAFGGSEVAEAQLLDRLEQVVGSVLSGAGLGPGALDALVLGGGMARLPAVQRRLADGLGRQPVDDLDVESAVAFGAALLGDSLDRPEGLRVRDLVPAEAPAPVAPPLARTPAEGEARVS